MKTSVTIEEVQRAGVWMEPGPTEPDTSARARDKTLRFPTSEQRKDRNTEELMVSGGMFPPPAVSQAPASAAELAVSTGELLRL